VCVQLRVMCRNLPYSWLVLPLRSKNAPTNADIPKAKPRADSKIMIVACAYVTVQVMTYPAVAQVEELTPC
jgi:hypothetical protein